MKFRVLSFLLACAMLLSVLSISAFASDNDTTVITYEDGSYLEITLLETDTRATNSKSGHKILSYTGADGAIEWKAVLNASFTYTGSTSTCTSASCTLTIYDSNWYQVSKSTSRSGNTATTVLTMGQKVLGVTIAKRTYTITLSCDANGNLS